MAGKKGAIKGKGKESESALSSCESWKKGKCTEADLQSLVDECLLQSKETVQWRPATGNVRPYEGVKEIIIFQHFVERGLAIPTCDFLRSLLFHYGIQLYHLNPNSVLHIAIFVHFYEAFLGREPHLDLFCYVFHRKPQPSEKNIAKVGGASLQLRQDMERKYIPYKFGTSLSGWKERWFYIGNPREDCWESQDYW
jgi:hypothetical protein